jgi:aspartate/methionine/tyrosine aminotransferase
VPYYLDEEFGWSASGDELRKQYDESVKKGVHPKILVCINPGNPTG